MNDYERLAEDLTHAEQVVNTALSNAEDSDIQDLLEAAESNVAEARRLAEERS